MFDSVIGLRGEPLLNIVHRAIDEKCRLQNRYICTEHLLLAIMRDPNNLATQALASMKIDVGAAQREIDKQLKEKTSLEALGTQQTVSATEQNQLS